MSRGLFAASARAFVLVFICGVQLRLHCVAAGRVDFLFHLEIAQDDFVRLLLQQRKKCRHDFIQVTRFAKELGELLSLAVNAPDKLGIFRRSSGHPEKSFLGQQRLERGGCGGQCGHGLARRAQGDEKGLQIIIDDVGVGCVEKIVVQRAEIVMNAGIFLKPALNERGIADGIDAGIEHIGRL